LLASTVFWTIAFIFQIATMQHGFRARPAALRPARNKPGPSSRPLPPFPLPFSRALLPSPPPPPARARCPLTPHTARRRAPVAALQRRAAPPARLPVCCRRRGPPPGRSARLSARLQVALNGRQPGPHRLRRRHRARPAAGAPASSSRQRSASAANPAAAAQKLFALKLEFSSSLRHRRQLSEQVIYNTPTSRPPSLEPPTLSQYARPV